MLEKLDKAPFDNFSVFLDNEEFYIGTLPHGITYYLVCGKSLTKYIYVRYHLPKEYENYKKNIYMKYLNSSFNEVPYFARSSLLENTDLELIYKSD